MTTSRTLLAAAFLALAPLAARAIPVNYPHDGSCGISQFRVAEGFANATPSGAVLNFIPRVDMDVRVSYGPSPGGPWTTMTATTGTAETMKEITVPASEGAHVWVRLECKASGTSVWGERPLAHFQARYASTTDASWTDIMTADPHGLPRWIDTEDRNCGTVKQENSDESTRTYGKIAARRPMNWFELGDQAHTHCLAPACDQVCSLPGFSADLDTGSTASADTLAEALPRQYLTLEFVSAARRQTNYERKAGNHEGRLFGMGITAPAISCQHNDAIGQAAEDSWLATTPNPNDVWPHGVDGDRGHFWHERNGQASYIFLDEYVYACESPASCAVNGLPDSPDDWTLGATQRAWLSSLDTETGDVIVVMMHHPPASCNSETCYLYGRWGPGAREGFLQSGDFNGDLQFMVDWAAARVLEGKTVLFVFGHDHHFVYGGTYQGVHFFVLGMPGNNTTNWVVSDAEYRDCWDTDGDGTPEYEDPSSPLYAPQPGDADFGGYATLDFSSSAPGTVMLTWCGTTTDEATDDLCRFRYTMTGSAITIERP